MQYLVTKINVIKETKKWVRWRLMGVADILEKGWSGMAVGAGDM